MNSPIFQPESTQKINMLPKISFIFGVLGIFPIAYWFNWNFLIFQIAAIPICLIGIISGIVSLIKRKNKSNKESIKALLGIVLGGLGALLFLWGGSSGYGYIIIYFFPMVAASIGLIGIIAGIILFRIQRKRNFKEALMAILGIVLGSLRIVFVSIFCIPYYLCTSC